MSKPAAAPSAALTVQAPQNGIARATSTVAESIDLGTWISGDATLNTPKTGHGRYITVQAEDADLYVLVSLTAAAAAGTIDGTFNSATADVAGADARVPKLIPAGQERDFVLDPQFRYLHHVAKTGAGRIRIHRS